MFVFDSYWGADCAQGKKQAAKVTVWACRDWVSRGRIRLVFTHEGKRYYLYLGIPDSVPARGFAEMVARKIESDIYAQNFDATLDRYRPEKLKRSDFLVTELLQSFIEDKERQFLDSKTLGRYRSLLSWVKKSIGGVTVEALSDRHVVKFHKALESGGLGAAQRRRRVEELRSCWEWAQSEGLIRGELNPWAKLHRTIKIPPHKPPEPFTQSEVRRIIAAFRSDPKAATFGRFCGTAVLHGGTYFRSLRYALGALKRRLFAMVDRHRFSQGS